MNQHPEFTSTAHLLYTRLKKRANRWCMNLLSSSFFLLCNIFSQFFLLSVWMRTHLSQADRLHSATFSLGQQANDQSQTIRSSFEKKKKKSFPWIVDRKIRAKTQMFFLARRTQFGSCFPKAAQIQKLYFPAFAIPSSFPFLPKGFVLLYKETWFNFSREAQKPLSEINTFFFTERC